jgi:hypothetical protein
VIFSVDHIVFAATPDQSRELREALVDAGFHVESFSLEFPEIGARSESVSFAGGGFAEFVAGTDQALIPRVWFEEIPRIIGLGFSSDEFDTDTSWFESGAWVMNEDHTLPDGTRLNIHAAGPHPHFSDFFVFVMDRAQGHLQFPEREQGPRLCRLSFAGGGAELWRDRLVEWLRLTQDSSSLRVGDVELEFATRSEPGVRVSALFEDTRSSKRIPLNGGSIELVSGPSLSLG